MSTDSPSLDIIGGGLVGSLLALTMSRKGYMVNVYERRPDIRNENLDQGKSINLALSHRGIEALKSVSLDEKILSIAIPMRGRRMHAINGDLTFHPYGKDETESINSVSRGGLNRLLLDEADKEENVEIFFDHRCIDVNYRTNTLVLRHEKTNEIIEKNFTTVIGTDGSSSAIRKSMMNVGRFDYSQSFLRHGYKELEIPAGENGEFLIEKNALHIWPRKSFMLIALPNLDGSFTCTLFLPFESGKYNFNNLIRDEDVLSFFEDQFSDALPLMPSLVRDFFDNPTGNLATISCKPWNVKGKSLLMGDAAHAIVPFYGQGMNCGFEDVSTLVRIHDKHRGDWELIFDEFSISRKVNSDAIANLSLENFIEMRDRVADEKFLLRREAESILYEKFPHEFISKYSMVTFHPEIPYDIAKRKGEILEMVLTLHCEELDRIENFDHELAYNDIINEYRKHKLL